MSNSTPTLIDLRHHYETIIAQSEYQSTQAKAQLAHIDALMEHGRLQTQETPLLETVAIAAGKPKRPGRKPEPTKEPKPQPEPVALLWRPKPPQQSHSQGGSQR
jgi:hypothetical protein